MVHVHLFILSFCLFVCSSQHVYNLSGKPDDGYYVQMDVGTPPSQFNLLVDTGSSNFAIAAYNNPNVTKYFIYSNSTTFKAGSQNIKVTYTQGHWKGVLGYDVVQLSGGTLPAVMSNIELITQSAQFFENGSSWHGILGLAYPQLAIATQDDYKPVPYLEGLLEKVDIVDGFSMQLCGPADDPNSDDIAMGGKLTLGAIDHTQYKGQLYKATIIEKGYYQLMIADIKVADESLNLDCKEYNTDKTILDSGTTNLRLPDKVFAKLLQKLKTLSSVENMSLDEFWTGKSFLCVGHNQTMGLFSSFPTVSLDLFYQDGETVTLTVAPQQYMRPVELSTPAKDCYKLGITGSSHGTVIGAVVMEGYYVYFDRTNSTILLAETTCIPRTQNSVRSTVTGYTSTLRTIQSCRYKPTVNTGLPTYAVILIAIGSFCLAVLLLIAILKLLVKLRKKRHRLRTEIDFDDLLDDSFATEY